MSTPGINDLHYQMLSGYQVLIDEASATVKYIGEALPGTAQSAAQWRIKKIDTSTNPKKISWANSTSLADKVWDDRASYTY